MAYMSPRRSDDREQGTQHKKKRTVTKSISSGRHARVRLKIFQNTKRTRKMGILMYAVMNEFVSQTKKTA